MADVVVPDGTNRIETIEARMIIRIAHTIHVFLIFASIAEAYNRGAGCLSVLEELPVSACWDYTLENLGVAMGC